MSKTHPRKSSSPPPSVTAAGRWDWVLLFFGALVLRSIGIGWGLPDATHIYSYHPDEIFVLQPALKMLQGDWNPHFFNYGTLYLYLVGIAAWLLNSVGLFEQSLLYPLGRMISAVMGASTVVLLYLTCHQLAGRRFALIAAVMLALTPLHLVNSHFATVDVSSTFFLMLGAWACVQIITAGKLQWYVVAGAAMGLATATKYTLAIGIVMVIGAHLLRSRQPARPHLWLIAALVAFPIFFLVGCPYALDGLHLRQEFIFGPNSIGFEMQHMRETRTPAFINTGSGWVYHALRGLPAALGIPLYLLSMVGWIFAVVQLRSSAKPDPGALKLSRTSFLFAVWALLFFIMIGAATERFIRYLVPLVPFCAFFAAVAVNKAVQSSELRIQSWKQGVSAGLVGMTLLLTIMYSLTQLWLFMKTDPRDRAFAAIKKLHPSTIGVQEVPWFRTPPVSPINAGVVAQARFEEWQQTAPYKVVVTGWSLPDLKQARPDVFTISDMQYSDELRIGNQQAKDFMTALPSLYSRQEKFTNPIPFEWLAGGGNRVPPDWLYLKPRVIVYSDWR